MDKLLSDGFAYNQTLQKPWVVLKLNDQDTWMPFGPYSETEVKLQLKSGEIKPSDYCWTSGWTDWKRIYLEPKFYLSRKPPLVFKSLASSQIVLDSPELDNSDLDSVAIDKKSIWSEIAFKISPKQYMGWKYKKTNRTENSTPSIIKDQTVSKDGVLDMLEPWDSKTKSLDFVDDAFDKNKTEVAGGATAINYPLDDIESEAKSTKTRGARLAIYALKSVLVMGIAVIVSLIGYRLYSVFSTPNQINFNMSYFVVEDYMNELPEYLYARTDLKKNQQIKIRVFDLSNKQMRTKNSKAGLMLTSKGTGRMRIPMYAYALEPGVYKVMIEIEDQTIEKEFSIMLNEASSENSSVLKK